MLRLLLPIIVLAAGLGLWEFAVRFYDIQPYVLPAPSLIFTTLVADWGILSESLLTTLITTLEGFVAAAVGGIALALLFNQSKLAGIFAVSLCGGAAGHARDRDRAAASDLSAAGGRRRGLRLDRRVLSRCWRTPRSA